MKKQKPATKAKLTVLGQICKLIPGHLVPKLPRKHGVDRQALKFTPMEPCREPSPRPVHPCRWAQRCLRRSAAPREQAGRHTWRGASGAQHPLPCEQDARQRHDGGVVLVGPQSLPGPVGDLRAAVRKIAAPVQKGRHRKCQHQTHPKLSGQIPDFTSRMIILPSLKIREIIGPVEQGAAIVRRDADEHGEQSQDHGHRAGFESPVQK